MKIQTFPESPSARSLVPFALGFRPFFLGGSILALASMVLWAGFWQGLWQPLLYGNPVWWHAHELIFGFGAAIVVGFLLTAVRNWTGMPTVSGWPLAVLFLLWLLPRFGLALSAQPLWLWTILDIAFLPCAAICVALSVFKTRQTHNIAFPCMLMLLAALNTGSHFFLLKGEAQSAMHIHHASIFLINLFVCMIGGRVIPFFTANASRYQRKDAMMPLEVLAIGSLAMLVILALFGLENVNRWLLGTLSLIAATSHFIRWLRWGGIHTFANPLLWSLHLSYMFLPVGLLLLALWSFALIHQLSAVLHCFTVGSMAGMILAMMSRVSLGHTARPLKVSTLIAFSFSLIGISAVIRALGVILFPQDSQVWILAAASCWCIAFAIFIGKYLPILLKPRLDNLPG